MIRYKDNTFEDYYIDPVTAVITDKNGVVQKTFLFQGRLRFKNMPVHCIMAHTYFGYKEGFHVHHLDENKLNNALSNLVYLTRSEHRRLHAKDKNLSKETKDKIATTLKGKHKSEETKAKLSAALKGRNFSEESRAKMSAAKKGKPAWNKGKSLSAEHKVKISATLKGKLKK